MAFMRPAAISAFQRRRRSAQTGGENAISEDGDTGKTMHHRRHQTRNKVESKKKK